MCCSPGLCIVVYLCGCFIGSPYTIVCRGSYGLIIITPVIKKKSGGGGRAGGRRCWKIYFFIKTFISHFTCYAIFNIKKNNIEKCPFTYWLNVRWFLQIVDRDSWNLYPLYYHLLLSISTVLCDVNVIYQDSYLKRDDVQMSTHALPSKGKACVLVWKLSLLISLARWRVDVTLKRFRLLGTYKKWNLLRHDLGTCSKRTLNQPIGSLVKNVRLIRSRRVYCTYRVVRQCRRVDM